MSPTKRKGDPIISFQLDAETKAALDVVAGTIEAHERVRRSAAIRKAIKMAAAQLADKLQT